MHRLLQVKCLSFYAYCEVNSKCFMIFIMYAMGFLKQSLPQSRAYLITHYSVIIFCVSKSYGFTNIMQIFEIFKSYVVGA